MLFLRQVIVTVLVLCVHVKTEAWKFWMHYIIHCGVQVGCCSFTKVLKFTVHLRKYLKQTKESDYSVVKIKQKQTDKQGGGATNYVEVINLR